MLERSYGIIPFREEGDILIIQDNHNNWGFPKGHPNSGEAPQDTAKRELKEETGTDVVRWIQSEPLITSYFNPITKQEKRVEYFPALVHGKVVLDPKEIKAFMWVLKEDLPHMLKFKEYNDIFSWIPTL